MDTRQRKGEKWKREKEILAANSKTEEKVPPRISNLQFRNSQEKKKKEKTSRF